jgi:hypothetical protein
MPPFKITLIKVEDKTYTESGNYVAWKTVPRKGEIVDIAEGQFVVLNVIHNFRRGMDSGNGEISIELERIK